ncbi:MAG TPA: hypothetical protein DHW64_13330 [Chitinophagaceae bacterium]|nr:hypothetical protein [Chitinophagaceae bacterium]
MLVLLALGFVFMADAQKRKLVYGYLKDSVTNAPIVLASVRNINTSTTVMTNNTGRFAIEVAENQILSFAAVGYFFDTLQYNNTYTLQDTLHPLLVPLARDLGNVTVTTRGMSRYQLDSMERRKDFLQDIVNYTIPTVSQANSGAGIALNLDRFSRHEKNKRRAMQFYETNEKEAYINYRFNTSLVQSLTGFKDEKLHLFIQRHRPSHEWLRKHVTEEDIHYYINEQLKLFSKQK